MYILQYIVFYNLVLNRNQLSLNKIIEKEGNMALMKMLFKQIYYERINTNNEWVKEKY